MRRWLSAHRSSFAALASGTVVAALVATLAVVSTGYTAQRMDLTDPSVWVSSRDEGAVGRANTQVFELDSVLPVDADAPEVVQSGSTVLLVDPGSATVRAIDPASAELGDDVALPPQDPELFLADDRVIIVAQGTGEVWFVPLGDLASFDAAAPSNLSLGADAVVAVSETGAMLAYVPETRQVWRVAPGDVVVGERWDVEWGGEAESTDVVQLTAVGERWAVLDVTTRELATEAGVRTLDGDALGGSVRIQQPGPANARVLIAHASGLLGAERPGMGNSRRVSSAP